VACARKEILNPSTEQGAALGSGAGQAALPRKLYVSQLPEGVLLHPHSLPSLAAVPGVDSRNDRSSSATERPQPVANSDSWSCAARGPDAGSVATRGSGEHAQDHRPELLGAQPGTQQQGPVEGGRRRAFPLSIAYLGAGVYLWGAGRDPLYRQ
jgi:hypothetical protein